MRADLSAARRSFDRCAWADACAQLAAADRQAPLAVDDLERLAVAAYLCGDDGLSADTWTRAFHACEDVGDVGRAARCAFWLAFGLLLRGEMAPAGGWLARAQRVLDDADRADRVDRAERGLLLVPVALQHLLAGNTDAALADFSEALAVGERFGDADVTAFGRLGRGQALIMSGQQHAGMAEFDDVMTAVTAGEVTPTVAGLVYCAVIELCQATFDLRRAQEWTAALTRWCDAQPDLVPYRGQCLVHRAEVLRVHGAWADAMDEARRAYEHLSRPPGHPAVGDALYVEGELLRLGGDLVRAEDAYRRASERGRDPQPGLARLRLAQGDVTAAAAAIRRAVDEAVDPVGRAQLLVAHVEIMLAAGDVTAARAGADELAGVATAREAPMLRAMAGYASGTVLLAEGAAREALAVLRPAWVVWRDLEAPYEAARTRVAVGLACRQLGDEDGAALELAAAATTFDDLGARADRAHVEHLAARRAPEPPGGLSAREVEVLRLVATGRTNRAIASELLISDKTVARHVANIFTKLGLSSRAAATAYAYEHGLVERGYTE